MHRWTNILMGVLLCLLFPSADAGAGSQWRGVHRDGIYDCTNLLKKWPEAGPSIVWQVDGIGEGHASVASTDDRVFVTGMRGSNGWLQAYDLAGKLQWQVDYGPEWTGSYSGTRSTPTIAGNAMYLLSGVGLVVCIGLDGAVVWTVNLKQRFGSKVPLWGFAESLVVDEGRVFVTVGADGAGIVALDARTGETVWTTSSLSDPPGYCSPQIVNRGKKMILVTMTSRAVVGVDAATGTVLWQIPHQTSHQDRPNTPLYHDGSLYCVSGYSLGGIMLGLSPDGSAVKTLWTNTTLDAWFGGVVLIDGHIYGTGHEETHGLVCLDWRSGLVLSEAPGSGMGAVIIADGMLYHYNTRGRMSLILPNQSRPTVVSSFQVTHGSGRHYAHPVIAHRRLYIRHGPALAAYDISHEDKTAQRAVQQ